MRKLLFTLLFFSLFLTQCEQINEKKAKGGDINVNALIIRPTVFNNQVQMVANILPMQTVDLKAPVAGNVLSIDIKEGAYIEANKRIVRIDDRRWISQRDALKAELSLVERDYERKKELLAIEATSVQEVEVIEDRIIVLKAEIANLKLNIELANITAPFSGKLGMLDISTGAYLNQGDAITTLSQTDVLKVDFYVPVDYIAFVKLNTTIKAIVQKDTLEATVYAISPNINEQSKTLQVRAKLIRPNNPKFMPGAYAEVLLEIDRNEQAVVIPTSAITYDINQQTVYLLKNGKVKRQKIEAGTVTPDQIEIKKGLQFGDTLITTGLLQIKEGMSVNLTLTKP